MIKYNKKTKKTPAKDSLNGKNCEYCEAPIFGTATKRFCSGIHKDAFRRQRQREEMKVDLFKPDFKGVESDTIKETLIDTSCLRETLIDKWERDAKDHPYAKDFATGKGLEFTCSDNELIISTTETSDPLVQGVINKMIKRSNDGIKNYGNTMGEARKPLVDWIEDVQEEMMDAVIYLEKVKQNLKNIL